MINLKRKKNLEQVKTLNLVYTRKPFDPQYSGGHRDTYLLGSTLVCYRRIRKSTVSFTLWRLVASVQTRSPTLLSKYRRLLWMRHSTLQEMQHPHEYGSPTSPVQGCVKRALAGMAPSEGDVHFELIQAHMSQCWITNHIPARYPCGGGSVRDYLVPDRDPIGLLRRGNAITGLLRRSSNANIYI